MARANLFEKLLTSWDLAVEANRINELIGKRILVYPPYGNGYTLCDFVNDTCFSSWKSRGHCLDVNDFLELLDYPTLLANACENSENYLDLIELTANLVHLANSYINQTNSYIVGDDFHLLEQIIEDSLEHYNYEKYYDKKSERVIIVEKSPSVTSVVEIEEDTNLAFEIVQYNHHALKGDIAKKKAILLKLGANLEPRRRELERINSGLSANIFAFLNNMNIRHNNIELGNAKYKQCIADMKPDELELWYDELYQMILLAKLELDNIERMKKADELRKNF